MSQDCGHHFPKDCSVPPQKLEASFARLLPNARAQDNRATTREVSVVSGSHFQWMSERDRVANIVRFGHRACFILVNKHDLAANAAHDEGIRCRGTD
jgi:hypothetical protein